MEDPQQPTTETYQLGSHEATTFEYDNWRTLICLLNLVVILTPAASVFGYIGSTRTGESKKAKTCFTVWL